jgi:hypothetical protein
MRRALQMLPAGTMLVLWGTVAFAGIAAAQEAQGRQLNARELFYSAAQAPAAAPQASSPAKTAPKTVAKKTSPPATEAARPETRPPAQASAPPVSQPATATASTDVAKVIHASVSSAPVGPPLGLKYTILKLAGGSMVEAAPDSIFHAGDRIQISVETNGPGYLYVITQGSSGTWRPMFPSAEVADGNNRVEGWRTSVLPPKSRFVFDEQKGVEKLFLVFSREPEPDLEKMIYSLQDGKTTPTADPMPQPGQQPQKQLMAAASVIDDSTVGRLRNTYARDLVIEKVDENTPGNAPGDKKETAVYVVNPSGSADSRVVADIQLVHQ